MLFNPTLYKIWGYFVLTVLYPIVLPIRVYEWIMKNNGKRAGW